MSIGVTDALKQLYLDIMTTIGVTKLTQFVIAIEMVMMRKIFPEHVDLYLRVLFQQQQKHMLTAIGIPSN